jgi:hypothetical protein
LPRQQRLHRRRRTGSSAGEQNENAGSPSLACEISRRRLLDMAASDPKREIGCRSRLFKCADLNERGGSLIKKKSMRCNYELRKVQRFLQNAIDKVATEFRLTQSLSYFPSYGAAPLERALPLLTKDDMQVIREIEIRKKEDGWIAIKMDERVQDLVGRLDVAYGHTAGSAAYTLYWFRKQLTDICKKDEARLCVCCRPEGESCE